MLRNRFPGRIGAAIVVWTAGLAGTLSAHEHPLEVQIGEVAFTLVGQVTNTPPDQSAQFGYLPTITGLTDLFASPTEDETTAFFTFYNNTTTKAVRHSGPLTIIEREGTTTVDYNIAPHASFADPNSFRDGPEAVLVMVCRSEAAGHPRHHHGRVLSGDEQRRHNGKLIHLGRVQLELAHRNGQFRWALQGHLNSPGPPERLLLKLPYVVKVQGD